MSRPPPTGRRSPASEECPAPARAGFQGRHAEGGIDTTDFSRHRRCRGVARALLYRRHVDIDIAADARGPFLRLPSRARPNFGAQDTLTTAAAAFAALRPFAIADSASTRHATIVPARLALPLLPHADKAQWPRYAASAAIARRIFGKAPMLIRNTRPSTLGQPPRPLSMHQRPQDIAAPCSTAAGARRLPSATSIAR